MAHAGEEVVFRPVQFFNLLFLPLGEGVFLLIHPIEEHEEHTGEQSHHNHGKRGVKQSGVLGIRRGNGRKIKGGTVAEQRLCRTQAEEHDPASSLQGDADINEAKYEPLRYSAVKSACGKKGDGKQREQQHRNSGGARVDPLFLNADLSDGRYGGKTCQQHQDIPNISAHGQRKRDCDHADACHNTKHPFAQADSVIGDNLEPFLYHKVFHSSEHDIFKKKAGGSYIPAIRVQNSSCARSNAGCRSRMKSTSPRFPASSSSFA